MMMDLAAALQWWDEWQLRILVLSSLAAQGILHHSFVIRTNISLRRLKALVWIAYVASDAIAIYALATLFNRHKEVSQDGVVMSSSLEIIWAPVLLIHLGGQPSISAFSMEDNELWKRHVITLVCQVTVALYVFCKWWSGDKRQLKAAVLLFIVGIIRFARKPWGLRSASFNSMTASADMGPQKELYSWRTMLTENFLVLRDRMQQDQLGGGEGQVIPIMSLEEYVEQANKCTTVDHVHTEGTTIHLLDDVGNMFIDMSAPYYTRLKDLRIFIHFDIELVHTVIMKQLNYTFLLLYTGERSIRNYLGTFSVILLMGLVVAPLVLFAKSNKDGYKKADITVTYILFACNVLLEFSPWLSSIYVILTSRLFSSKPTSYYNMVSQYNLISFGVRKKNPTFLMKLATFKCLGDYINEHWYIEQVPETLKITGLLNQHVKDGWRGYISDAAGYKRFNSFRGQRTLRRHHQLQWVLKMPFDQSVLLWHIATELCFHYQISTIDGRQTRASESRLISDYMAYLFSEQPEMLMLGTRRGLLKIATHELGLMMMDFKAPVDNEEMLVREIMEVTSKEMAPTMDDLESTATITKEQRYAFTPILGARDLAISLIELGEPRMWNVIQGVWVEMLCYSASRCRGYLHAKSLGHGGEYLTTVGILLSRMGMETFAYMVQSPEVTVEE